MEDFEPPPDYDWSQPRISLPLKHFRPPLRTDPRNIVAGVCKLTLEESTQHISPIVCTTDGRNNNTLKKNAYSSSSLICVSEAKAQQRLEQKRVALAQHLPSKYNFRIIPDGAQISDKDAKPNCPVTSASDLVVSDFSSSLSRKNSRAHEQKRVHFAKDLPQRYDSHIIDDKVPRNPILSNVQNDSSSAFVEERKLECNVEKHFGVQLETSKLNVNSISNLVCSPVRNDPISQKSTEERLKNIVHANYHVKKHGLEVKGTQYYWRFRNHASKHPDHDQDSGVDSPVCSTPLHSLETSICSDIDDSEADTSLGIMDKNTTSRDKSLDSHLDVSIDQTSVDDLEDSGFVCSNRGELAPQPTPLIAVPEHLRCDTSNMNESSISDSSSGVSSLCQSERDDSISVSSQRSMSPVPKVGDQSVSYDCPESQEKVLASWTASFSASTMKGPVKCSSNFVQGETSTSAPERLNEKWDDSSSMSAMGLPTSFGTSMKRKATDSPRSDSSFEEMTTMYFSKQFKFKSAGWKLPATDTLFTSDVWELEDFISLKQRLNSVKDELNDFPLQDWHAHTRRRNKAGNVIWQLRRRIDPEFPTQAWCKFYENASSFPLVPQKAIDKKCLYSIHLCEAPGAFITSLNHFLRVRFGTDFKFDWRAVTLNPYYEGNPLSCMINDDRLVLKTLDKWLFGKDNTGDLMNKENLLDIIEKASELEEILLITADGSIDCQNNPAEQEAIVSWLHYCETVAALHMLAPGGSFLIKMFTFYEQSSICLLYLLNCMFKTVAVNKPATSKEGNSEVYVVCCEFKGIPEVQPWLDVLLKNYGSEAPEKALFSLKSIPSSFLDEVYNCADFFRVLQTDVIEENIRSFQMPQRRDSYVTATMRHRVAENFFSRYKIRKMDREFYLVDKHQLKNVTTPNIDPKTEGGSFNDRKKRLTLSPQEELKCLSDDLLHLNVGWPGDFDVFWLDFPQNPQGFKIVRGKPITTVNSSKFCSGSLLQIRNRVRELAYDKFKSPVLLNPSQCDDRAIPWPDAGEDLVKRKVFILDFKNVLWASLEDGSNAVHEKDACRKILSAIENEIFRDDCLELRGYPLLTQFNVGLVFLLGHLFEKVGFVKPLGQDIRVLFYKYRKFHPEMKQHWDKVVSEMDIGSEAVLSVLDSESVAGKVDISSVMSKCSELQVIKDKLLVLGRTEFNVCLSMPNTSSSNDLIKWPEKLTSDIKKLWVSSSDIKTAIEDVIDEVSELWRDDCFILHGYPLTSNLSLNALFTIGQLFDKVGIVKPEERTGTTICFFQFQKWTSSCERRMNEILKKVPSGVTDQNADEAFSNNICSNEFLRYLLTMNLIELKNEVTDLLQNIEEADNQINYNINLSDTNNNTSICDSCKTNGRCSIRCKKLCQKLDNIKSYLQQIDQIEQENLVLEFSETPKKELLEIVPKSSKPFSIMEIEQFCLRQLLCCHKKLCEIFTSTLQLTEEDIRLGSCLRLDPNENILTSLLEPPWAPGPIEVKVLDFGNELWMFVENHAEYQSEILLRICGALEDTWRGESLELRGFPILSEFNASLILILGHLFDKVRFSFLSLGRNSIFFENFRNYPRNVREHFEKVISDVSLVHHEAVLSLVPLKFLYRDEFYDVVRSANNSTLLKRCLLMVKVLCVKMDESRVM
ncbi:Cap-specific mRNA (nucleoside-2'-O-)-methyltransferase 2 [Frankliniella fusca]|uniref:Cap-specific mRNA (nucleoside-2'-O-)-methyltransferase 2 n=1 Tax=Frankliniella fusca TaxID=407009 RepID=A0AAE1LHW7_9NEOP|nr:Cap-specific mRNA (nucleoside-2'-O-)-methyltransferase 2 [Frankliniella fusca]